MVVAKLDEYKKDHPADQVAGALQVSCLGRGQTFLGVANHDVGMLQQSLGPLPVGGFFGSGEIGPIGPSTHLHGFTTVMGLVHPRSG